MPQEIIRPDSTTSLTGWSPSTNIHLVIGDNDPSTTAVQNSTTCNFTGTLSDLSIDASSTINYIQASLLGVAGRTGSTSATVNFSHPTDGSFGSASKSVTGLNTYVFSKFETQQDGSSALTVAYVNDLSIVLTPATSGITVHELFVTVDYTEPAVLSGKIVLTSGRETLTTGKITL